MRSNHSFSIDFVTRKCKADENKALIYARITVDGEEPVEISTYLLPSQGVENRGILQSDWYFKQKRRAYSFL